MPRNQVEADSETEAVFKLMIGAASPADHGPELIEVCDDYGLPAEEHPELAAELTALGIKIDAVIPSIHAIEEVE